MRQAGKKEKQDAEFCKPELRASHRVAAANAKVAKPDAVAPIVPVQAKPKEDKPVVISVEKMLLGPADDDEMFEDAKDK